MLLFCLELSTTGWVAEYSLDVSSLVAAAALVCCWADDEDAVAATACVDELEAWVAKLRKLFAMREKNLVARDVAEMLVTSGFMLFLSWLLFDCCCIFCRRETITWESSFGARRLLDVVITKPSSSDIFESVRVLRFSSAIRWNRFFLPFDVDLRVWMNFRQYFKRKQQTTDLQTLFKYKIDNVINNLF